MELLQLKYFCDAAETENFSKTAQKFNVPSSNISQTISRLENELEVKLFDRTANRITLNELGQKFYINIKTALEKIEDAKKITEEHSDEISGEIRLQICTNRRIVTKAIEKFKLMYPKVSFILDHSITSNNNFDIIISDGFMNKKNMSKRLMVTEEILLAAEKNNPILKNKSLNIEDLASERFITMPKNSSLYNITTEICTSAGFIPNIAIQTDDPFYIRKYVELGLGIAFVPAFSWKGLFSDNVICKSIGKFKRDTYIYTSKDRYMAKATREFLNLLLEICKPV